MGCTLLCFPSLGRQEEEREEREDKEDREAKDYRDDRDDRDDMDNKDGRDDREESEGKDDLLAARGVEEGGEVGGLVLAAAPALVGVMEVRVAGVVPGAGAGEQVSRWQGE